MARTRAIDGLAASLQGAAARADWDGLHAALRELGPRLEALAGSGPWSANERAALARLREAHERARAGVDGAALQAQASLSDMAENKEGWMAYALAGEPEPEQN